MKAIIVSLCLFAIGIVIVGFAIDNLMMADRAKTWPTIQGTIKSSRCEFYCDMEDLKRSYVSHVNYRYAVSGKSYQGTRIAFGYSGSSWKRPYQKITDYLSSAKTVLVRYDPDKPSTSVLSYGLNGSIVERLFLGSWIMFVATAIWRYALQPRLRNESTSLSFGSSGRFSITVQGIGGIVLLGATGWIITSFLAFVIDIGILSTIITK